MSTREELKIRWMRLIHEAEGHRGNPDRLTATLAIAQEIRLGIDTMADVEPIKVGNVPAMEEVAIGTIKTSYTTADAPVSREIRNPGPLRNALTGEPITTPGISMYEGPREIRISTIGTMEDAENTVLEAGKGPTPNAAGCTITTDRVSAWCPAHIMDGSAPIDSSAPTIQIGRGHRIDPDDITSGVGPEPATDRER